MKMDTKTSQSPVGQTRRLYRFFAACDVTSIELMRRVEKFFSHGTVANVTLEYAEPAISGFVVSLILLSIDSFRGSTNVGPLFSHFLDSAIDHARPLLFFVGLLLLAISMVVTGSVAGRPIRRFVVAPILRLVHHVTMLALGVFFVLTVNEFAFVQFSVAKLGLAIVASWILGTIGGVAFLGNRYIDCKCVHRLERYMTFRLMSTTVGLVLCVFALFALREELVAFDKSSAHEKSSADSHPPTVPPVQAGH